MSSTNRGAERQEADYYRTPMLTIKRFLDAFNADYPSFRKCAFVDVLDPCAGGRRSGQLIEDPEGMPYPAAIKKWSLWPVRELKTIDIRADSQAEHIGDYMMVSAMGRYDIVISNPPFEFAQDFIRRALEDTHPNGVVAFLLRLNFLGGQARSKWWKNHMPSRIYVDPIRPKFLDGHSDSCEYAHFVWTKPSMPVTESILKLV